MSKSIHIKNNQPDEFFPRMLLKSFFLAWQHPASPYRAFRSAEIFLLHKNMEECFFGIRLFQTFPTHLKIKVLYWHWLFCEEHLTSINKHFHLTKGSLNWKKVLCDYLRSFKNGSSVTSLWKASFVIFILKSVIVYLLSRRRKKCCFTVFESRHCWIKLTFLPGGPSGPMSPLGPGKPCR